MKNKMLVLGITGSVGMGKTTTAKMFQKKGAALFQADACVHDFMKPTGAAYQKIFKAFPEAHRGTRICRKKLGRAVYEDDAKREKLEKILHPLVKKEARAFIKEARAKHKKIVILDIPLLFETGMENLADKTLCVCSTKALQKKRVFERSKMSEERLKVIVKHQLPCAEKKKRADFVITTNKTLDDIQKQVDKIWKKLRIE